MFSINGFLLLVIVLTAQPCMYVAVLAITYLLNFFQRSAIIDFIFVYFKCCSKLCNFVDLQKGVAKFNLLFYIPNK